MRVIAGKWKGRAIVAPNGTIARPTTDRVKESMFNLMGLNVHEGYVLDLFAGSGALGIEALSRGATHAVFVDQNVKSLNTVKENLNRCEAMNEATVWRADWKTGLAQFVNVYKEASWVFLDPPYQKNLWESVLVCLNETLNVSRGIVCEHPKTNVLPEKIGMYSIWKHKVYGDIAVTIYSKEKE